MFVNDASTGGITANHFSLASTTAPVSTLADFTAGSKGDVLDISALMAKNASGFLHDLNANPAASTAYNKDILLLNDYKNQGLGTVSGLQTALGGSGEYSHVNLSAPGQTILITTETATPTVADVYYETTASGGHETVTLVGVMDFTGHGNINALVAGNFV